MCGADGVTKLVCENWWTAKLTIADCWKELMLAVELLVE
jgi:hypothetical protein